MGGEHSKQNRDGDDKGRNNDGERRKDKKQDRDKARGGGRKQKSGKDSMEKSSSKHEQDGVEAARDESDQAEEGGGTKAKGAVALDGEVTADKELSTDANEDNRVMDDDGLAEGGEKNSDAVKGQDEAAQTEQVTKVGGLSSGGDIGADKPGHADSVELPKSPVLGKRGDTADISGLEGGPDEGNGPQLEAEGGTEDRKSGWYGTWPHLRYTPQLRYFGDCGIFVGVTSSFPVKKVGFMGHI